MYKDHRQSVKFVRKAAEARVLYEPMRREILRLLCKTPMTQTHLGKVLGLRNPTIGHHIQALRRIGFVSVVRQDIGTHGIVEKYYGSSAQVYYIDRSVMPLDVRRYYMPVDIERARGVLAGALMRHKNLDPSSELTENFATALALDIGKAAARYETPVTENDPEAIISRLYCEALENVLKSGYKEIRDILNHTTFEKLPSAG